MHFSVVWAAQFKQLIQLRFQDTSQENAWIPIATGEHYMLLVKSQCKQVIINQIIPIKPSKVISMTYCLSITFPLP